jgi:adenylosuccinate lyase
MISQLTQNFKNIEFDENKIEENLNLTKGACLAEKIMVELVNRKIGRQEAHEILRNAAIAARKENKFMKDVLFDNKLIREKFSKEELDNLLDPHKYIGLAFEQTKNLLDYLKEKYN